MTGMFDGSGHKGGKKLQKAKRQLVAVNRTGENEFQTENPYMERFGI